MIDKTLPLLHDTAPIAIIAAMQEEIHAILSEIKEIKTLNAFDYEFFTGKFNYLDVVLVKSKIGKVNACVCISLLVSCFNINKIINVGSAGALDNRLKTFDIVIANGLAYHDVDLTGFNYLIGQLPNMPLFYCANSYSDSEITKKLPGLNIYSGLVVSGDQFINSKEDKEKILQNFNEALCVDMESTAIAQSGHIYHIPVVIIKSISDNADGSATNDFKQYVDKVSYNLLAVLKAII
jgi:adenosylhomocysteine nucleosidase